MNKLISLFDVFNEEKEKHENWSTDLFFLYDTHWNEKASATVLSETDAEHIFKSNWKIKPDFEKISNEYKENVLLLKEWHLKRFGNLVIDYVHAGNILVKK